MNVVSVSRFSDVSWRRKATFDELYVYVHVGWGRGWGDAYEALEEIEHKHA